MFLRRDFIKSGILGMGALAIPPVIKAGSTDSTIKSSTEHEKIIRPQKNIFSRGLWSVMLTPFTEDLKVDLEGLRGLTEYYIQNKVNGLFANCGSSEMFTLSDDERLQIIHTVIETTNNRLPIVASGTFSSSQDKNIDFIKKVYDLGVDGVIIISNQIVSKEESDDLFKKRIEYILKQTGDIPLGIYECPSPYKRLLSPSLMKFLGETNHFFFHKDTSCDPDAIKQKIDAIQGTPLSFFNADTPTSLISLRDGGDGLATIAANCYPELYLSLIKKLNLHENPEEIERLNAQLVVMDSVAGQNYPHSAKIFLQKRGLSITSACRSPYSKMKPDGLLKIEALFDLYNKILERV